MIDLYRSDGSSTELVAAGKQGRVMEWLWMPACSANNPNQGSIGASCTAVFHACPNPPDELLQIFAQDVTNPAAPGPAKFVALECLSPLPTVNLAVVRNTVQEQFRKAVTSGTVNVQPKSRSLIGVPTIFYARTATVVHLDVAALGVVAHLVGTPRSWTWSWGDGTPSVTGSSPGHPYPDQDVTHTYLHHGSYPMHVVVRWTATFTVDGIGFTFQLPSPVAAPASPTVTVMVRSAEAHLVSQP